MGKSLTVASQDGIMSAGACEEAASIDERQDSVSESAVANTHTQDKRRWDQNHQGGDRDSVYSYCHPFPASSSISPPYAKRFLSSFPSRSPALPYCQGDTLCTSFPPSSSHPYTQPSCGHGGEVHSKLVFHSILSKGTTQEDNFPQIKLLGLFPSNSSQKKCSGAQ